ncbi:MAG: hypothetical protein JNJ83_11085 [Verrucomicrobiaceae bacterium]|nr:hypothetical protein [Verrucomicrobiaceae bacterium]
MKLVIRGIKAEIRQRLLDLQELGVPGMADIIRKRAAKDGAERDPEKSVPDKVRLLDARKRNVFEGGVEP